MNSSGASMVRLSPSVLILTDYSSTYQTRQSLSCPVIQRPPAVDAVFLPSCPKSVGRRGLVVALLCFSCTELQTEVVVFEILLDNDDRMQRQRVG